MCHCNIPVQVVSSGLCYYFARLACKLCMQRFSFAVPLSLATPVSVAAMITLCYVSPTSTQVGIYTGRYKQLVSLINSGITLVHSFSAGIHIINTCAQIDTTVHITE